MKVRELIAQLSEVNQDSEVFIWIDGERTPVHSVDDNFNDNWYVDINADFYVDINGIKENAK